MEKVFRITEDEKLFDEEHEDAIRDWLAQNVPRMVPSDTIEEERFNATNPRITVDEFNETIKQTEQRAPRLSSITKRHLTEAPPRTLQQILDIFNAFLNTGYYPDAFKMAKMIFIPKPGWSPDQPVNLLNYRPVVIRPASLP